MPETNAPAFTAWLDDFFASYYRHRPVNATFIGVHEYDDRLPDLSPAGVDALASEMRALRQRLRDLPDEPLTVAERIDRDLAEGFLEIQEWELGSSHFQRGNPSLYTGEAVFGVLSLFLRPFAPIGDRVESAIARLEAIPELLAQGEANVRGASLAWTERAIRECTGTLNFLTERIDLLAAQERIDDSRLRRAAGRAAEAIAAFQHYLETDLAQRPTNGYAAGPEALDLLIRRGHLLDLDAEAIADYAQAQIDESLVQLEAGATAFGAPDWRTALAQLTQLHPTADRYERSFGEVWKASNAFALEQDLLTWPDYPIRYVPRPDWSRSAAPYLYFLFYRAPAAFDRVPVVDYLIAPFPADASPEEQRRFLEATNDSVIKLNHVVHHGGIGHHVQNWHAYRAASRVGQVAAVDCASRIAMFCGGTMAEGWACYATTLMGEAGFLTPLERYGEHHARMRMAARALVDVRLHTGAISLDEAAAVYRDVVGMSAAASHGEAVKNSMFPGAALMYLMGTDTIAQLRADLAAAQSAAFSLREFHDRFLSYGSIPVARIAKEMKAAVAQQG